MHRPLVQNYFMQDIPCKRALKEFCGVMEGQARRNSEMKWSAEALQHVIECCSEPERCQMSDVLALRSILIYIRDWCASNNASIPGPFCRLLLSISRDYPINALLRHKGIVGSDDWCPLLAAMQANLTTDLSALPTLRYDPPTHQI